MAEDIVAATVSVPVTSFAVFSLSVFKRTLVLKLHAHGNDYDMSGIFLSHALGFCNRAVRKRAVDNAALKRIHRLELDFTAKPYSLIGKPQRKSGKGFLTLFPVVLAIDNHLFALALMLVEEGKRKILEGVEGFASITDNYSAVLALYADEKRIILLLYGRAGFQAHTFESAVYKLGHFVGDIVPDRNANLSLGKDSALGKNLHLDLIL